jgi:hypothetical protein
MTNGSYGVYKSNNVNNNGTTVNLTNGNHAVSKVNNYSTNAGLAKKNPNSIDFTNETTAAATTTTTTTATNGGHVNTDSSHLYRSNTKNTIEMSSNVNVNTPSNMVPTSTSNSNSNNSNYIENTSVHLNGTPNNTAGTSTVGSGGGSGSGGGNSYYVINENYKINKKSNLQNINENSVSKTQVISSRQQEMNNKSSNTNVNSLKLPQSKCRVR